MSGSKKSYPEMIGEILRDGAMLYFIFALLEEKLEVDGNLDYTTCFLCMVGLVAGMVIERKRNDTQ